MTAARMGCGWEGKEERPPSSNVCVSGHGQEAEKSRGSELRQQTGCSDTTRGGCFLATNMTPRPHSRGLGRTVSTVLGHTQPPRHTGPQPFSIFTAALELRHRCPPFATSATQQSQRGNTIRPRLYTASQLTCRIQTRISEFQKSCFIPEGESGRGNKKSASWKERFSGDLPCPELRCPRAHEEGCRPARAPGTYRVCPCEHKRRLQEQVAVLIRIPLPPQQLRSGCPGLL